MTFGYCRDGDTWAVTKNGKVWISGLRSQADAANMVDILWRDNKNEQDKEDASNNPQTA